MDLKKIFELAQRLGLGVDTVLNLYRKHPGAIKGVFKFFKDIFDDEDEASEVVPVPAPTTPPITPPGVPPIDAGRVIVALKARFYFIERDHQPISKPDFDKVLSGQDPLDGGDRVHLDITPFDQFGNEVRPGSKELGQLLNPDGTNRMQYLLSDGATSITNEYDDYGCTPVLKVPRGLGLNFEGGTGVFSANFVSPIDSRLVSSNELPSLRVKPWSN